MKKIFSLTNVFVAVMMLGCTLGFSSCSDDDDSPEFTTDPVEITTKTMYGSYQGKMTTTAIEAQDDAPAGVDITATVANDSVCFESFPVKDLIVSILGDEEIADNIISALGDVSYKVAYTPTLTPKKDFINMEFKAEPLKLALTMPSANEGEEAQTMIIEVEIEAAEEGKYTVEDGNLAFAISATKVFLGKGESKVEFPGFAPTRFAFYLNQFKIAHHSGL